MFHAPTGTETCCILEPRTPNRDAAVLVSDIMCTNVRTVRPDESLNKAIDMMGEHGIRHLVITDDKGALVSVFSERDIWRHLAFRCHTGSKSCWTEQVRELTARAPISISPSTPVEDAAELMSEKRLGCLPVVERARRVVGIITIVDLLHSLSAQLRHSRQS